MKYSNSHFGVIAMSEFDDDNKIRKIDADIDKFKEELRDAE